MFKQTIKPFGSFKKYSFNDDATGNGFDLVPQYGACLLDLRFAGKSVLDGYTTPEELIANHWSKNIVLFPFPNRLRDGVYHHRGLKYQFEQNNPATNNAIHGFGKNARMEVLKSGVLPTHPKSQISNLKSQISTAYCKCTYTDDGSHPAYPFPFKFEIEMSMTGDDFTVEMKFTNEGRHPIPVGLGWHPYFKIAETSNEVSLQLPECNMIEIDDRMLPTGNQKPYTDFQKIRNIGNDFLDNGFYITGVNKTAETILQSEQGRLTVWQETGAAKWNFVQVFTPPHRQSIAIEPMTCNIDAFNNHDGLILLHPKGKLDGKLGVKWSAKI